MGVLAIFFPFLNFAVMFAIVIAMILKESSDLIN